MDSVSKIFEKYYNNYNPVNIDATLTEILSRRLPKICEDKATTVFIKEVNDVLKKKIQSKEIEILDLHSLTYCGAQTVIKLCECNQIPVYHHTRIPKKFPLESDAQQELFKISRTKFKQLLFKDEETTYSSERPKLEEIENFWSSLWSQKPPDLNPSNLYLQNEESRLSEVTKGSTEITLKDLNKCLKRKKNWSTPGIDGLQIFWFKKFESVRKALLVKINQLLQYPKQMPSFFTVGFTELHPKNEETTVASNYRPITYLPSIYKIITRCIYQRIFKHYETNNVLTNEQCGGRRGYNGLKNALIIDSIALEEETVWGCYLDFQKAFDMVSHEWVLKLLQIYKIGDNFINFLKHAMENWSTRIYLEPDLLTSCISFKRGVFQGDSISVLLYWTAINPLSQALKNTNLGLNFKGARFSHLLYMDDLKLYSSNIEDLKNLVKVVYDFADAACMKVNKKKSHVFSKPPSEDLKEIDGIKYNKKPVLYLGYLQCPTIRSDETIYHKVRRFQDKLQRIKETKISEEDKTTFNKFFVYNPIFKTFGVLHWEIFKRALLQVEMKKKCVPFIEEKREQLEDVYVKLFTTIYQLRQSFYEKASKSDFMRMIVEKDEVTPLKLAERNHEKYIRSLIESVEEKKKKKKTKPIK